MTRWIPAIAPGVVFENVGDQTLVLVGNPPQVVRLSQEATELLTLIQQNPGNEIEQTPALSQLVDLGVVDGPSTSALSRRNVLQLSAVAGAVGLSTVLLPNVAMASSTESSPFDITGTYQIDGSGNVGLRLDPGPVTKAQAGSLTLQSGFDTFGSGGEFWTTVTSSTGWVDPAGGPLLGTFTFDGDEYTVTFREISPG
ncbi:hypothetical protein C3B54_111597 [Pontimonas salivibrio]|uniref:Twin-arginine translocation signal domain-containing protein n=1 Tax=Pontimonas salivibrio TaxID=1159327 RepID=A0A2L2BS75_9MICO|nr:twin-arginine translocation signal domain-containing protein [Pontimonas salivibrio]AVG24534.1 hypothetical protein C3B54_111597 [Pontimonas salivibrio]